MLIDFSQIKEVKIPGMNDGTGEMSARMYMDEQGKIIPTTIHSGGSIGLHKHPTSDDINYMISGTGKAVCNGQEEILNAGTCHICKKVLNIVFPIQDQRIWYCLHLLWNDEKKNSDTI